MIQSREARAGGCLITGPRYQLRSDTIEWQMKTRIGQSCIRGIRFSNVANPVIKIISPPRFGELTLLGPSFSYRASAAFRDEDFVRYRSFRFDRKGSRDFNYPGCDFEFRRSAGASLGTTARSGCAPKSSAGPSSYRPGCAAAWRRRTGASHLVTTMSNMGLDRGIAATDAPAL